MFPPAIPSTSHTICVPFAGQSDAANVCVNPRATLADGGESAVDAAQVIVTVALADFVVSATLVAVTVTLAGEGTLAGAVYVALAAPFATIVPTIEFPPAPPFTLHVTAVDGAPGPVTVAVNPCAAFVATLALVGEIPTSMSSCNVTLADPLALGDATLTAVTVTVAGDGSTFGAVYVPLVEIVPTLEFPPACPFTSHVTAASVVPVTVA